MVEQVNKNIVSFLMKANLPDQTSVKQEQQLKQEKLETSRQAIGSPNTNSPNNNSKNLKPIIVKKEISRNEKVKITNGSETKEIKWKKAKPLIESGNWKQI